MGDRIDIPERPEPQRFAQPVTVRELIAALEKLSPDAVIYVYREDRYLDGGSGLLNAIDHEGPRGEMVVLKAEE